jgi:hypothetical protein
VQSENRKTNLSTNIDFKKNEIIPPPILVKDEQGSRLESQNVVYQNIYLSRDEDDPVIVKPAEYVSVEKKTRKEDKLEEQCCHGEAISDLQINDKSEMLEGDKSLKNYLKIDEENSEKTSCKVTFQENKEKIEEFYKTNIETLLENRNKLADARERHRLRKIDKFGNKELMYERDPFEWELVRDRDGLTKVRIIGEKENDRNIDRDEDHPVIVKPTEYVSVDKKIRKEDKLEEQCCHDEAISDSQINDKSEMLEGDKSLKNFLKVTEEGREKSSLKIETFQESKAKIEEFYKTNIESLLENQNKLADTREKYRLRKLEKFGNKELIYEMDPFEWELVRDRDGLTKVKIIGQSPLGKGLTANNRRLPRALFPSIHVGFIPTPKASGSLPRILIKQ